VGEALDRTQARVRILEDALVDQIAAGEVVERPASIVKELLENALDAGATTISVAIDGGGVGRIRVTDDGHGMTSEDARLAMRRHATSKISSIDDLEAIATLGFRGEALPSIASVSRFSLTTRTPSAVAATRLETAGAAEQIVREVGGPIGTTVEVTDLFHNVPARRKFLKSQATESAHIADTCLRVALSKPALRLTLSREGRTSRQYLPAKDRKARAEGVFKERLKAIEVERDGVRVEAYLGPPERARSGAGGLHVFVNDRPVRDRGLARAVAFAYGSVLPPGRYPVGVVYVGLDPRTVDINVHPQKAEVRFANGRAILDGITRALAGALGTTAFGGPESRSAQYWNARISSTPPDPRASRPEADPWGLTGALRDATTSYGTERTDANLATESDGPPLEPPGFFGSMRVLGQVRLMLIVCEGDDALHVIDQHAADERIKYDALRKAHLRGEVTTQRLLFPERLEVSASESALVEERREEIGKLGLDVSVVGATTVAVHAVPQILARAAPDRLLAGVLGELSRSGERSFGDAVDTALANMACHGAIRAGDSLSNDECRALLRELDGIDEFAGHCPHGRPVVHSVPLAEVERRLGR